MREFYIYVDGASSGNPGPSGIGIQICDFNGKVIKEISEYIGYTTNNVAEYVALIVALYEIKDIIRNPKQAKVFIFSDSELLVKQMKGKYKTKTTSLIPLNFLAKNFVNKFKKLKFHYLPREKNKYADKLANFALKKSKIRT
jgi:ribonuclease HI